jgi:hypothetical protein
VLVVLSGSHNSRNRKNNAPVNAKSIISSIKSSQDTEAYDSTGHPEFKQRPTPKSRASMSLFRFRADTPEGETTGYWNRQRSGFAGESVYIPSFIGLTVGGRSHYRDCTTLTHAGFNPARDFGPRRLSRIWRAGKKWHF